LSIYDVNPVSFADYRRRAKKRLPGFLFHYIDGAANSEATAAANVNDFGHYRLKQRVMVDVSQVDTSTLLAGLACAMPVVLAPVGMAGLFARRGEVQAVGAADTAGIPFTLSTLGICPLEELRQATEKPFWFQLYMLRDRDIVQSLLERAQRNGCDTLVFTVDLAVAGMRLRDFRNGMVRSGRRSDLSKLAQLVTRPGWAFDVGIKGKPHGFGNLSEVISNPEDLGLLRDFVESQFDASVTWEDIAWLRAVWNGKILIKGILEADDARAAVDVGADGVVVSNHGGRQLDSVASGICKLQAVVAAVGDQTEVYMDGGIRSGIDVVKAIALGAKGVMIGRPWVFALAACGASGLARYLGVIQKEIATAMALMGVNRIEEITADTLEIDGK
jgi:L-lactate dehydrogenase (cytochrome)